MESKTKLENALLVMLLTPHIRAYLEAYDPKALEQAKDALVASGCTHPLDLVL